MIGMRVFVGALAVAAIVLAAALLIVNQPVPDVNDPGRTSDTGETTQGFADITVTATIETATVNVLFGSIATYTDKSHTVKIVETEGAPAGPVMATVWPSLGTTTQCMAQIKMFWADSADSGVTTSKEKAWTSGSPVVFQYGHLYLFPGRVSLTFQLSAKCSGEYVQVSSWQMTFQFDGVNEG